MTRLQILETYGSVTCKQAAAYNGYQVSMENESSLCSYHGIRETKAKAVNVVYDKVVRHMWHTVLGLDY